MFIRLLRRLADWLERRRIAKDNPAKRQSIAVRFPNGWAGEADVTGWHPRGLHVETEHGPYIAQERDAIDVGEFKRIRKALTPSDLHWEDGDQAEV